MASRPVVFLNDTTVDHHHGCTRVMRTMRLLAAEHGLEVIDAAPAHRDWRQSASFLRSLQRARLIIVNGEGTIHHDRPAGRQLLEVGRVGKELGIPVAMINMSWEANSAPLGELLRDFELVAVRESRSQRAVAMAGVNARRVPDLSLYFPHARAGRREGVGYTDSVVPDVSERLRLLRDLHGGVGVSIFDRAHGPVARVRLLRRAVSNTAERSLAGRLRSATCAWREVAIMSPTENAFIDRVARLSLLVTGRFHAMCFAMVTATPFIAVETNTHKIEGMLADSGLASWRGTTVADVDGPLLQHAGVWEADEMERLDAFLSDTRQRIDGLFDDLSRLAK
jgi:polysaccharide pyruvyl transferase WcaK-like protein